MSMAMVLEGTRDYLRTQNSWGANQCAIQFGGIPPKIAGGFFVALDDGGIESGPEDSYYLKEVFTIEVAIWRRSGQVPKDRRGQALLADDIYRSTIYTLDDLERMVVTKLHGQWALLSSINTQFGLPATGADDKSPKGDAFSGRLSYQGRSRNETAVPFDAPQAVPLLGRRLRFRGLMRLQKISNME